jgi:hypothetical protein
MIAFASSITAPAVYERCALRGFKLAAERDTEILSQPSAGSIFRSYNAILDRAALREDVDALVLVHQDAEIVDPVFCQKFRAALKSDDVGVVGCVGAIGVRNIAWWEGSATWGSFLHRYQEMGGGEFPAFSWNKVPPHARTGEVDMVDGFVLGLSRWAVENIRFDESLGLALHGYDCDFCLQVREAGRAVVTADFKVIHHHSLDLVSDPESYISAHMKVAEKWEGRIAQVGTAPGDWKTRARRAEAEAAAARLQATSKQMEIDARERQYEHDLEETLTSLSWRVTAPFRRLAALRGARRRAPRARRGRARSSALRWRSRAGS